MELNKAACEAAAGAFAARLEGKPTTSDLLAALRFALEAYEGAREANIESLPRPLLDEIAGLYCPSASGFEGPETYPDCGACVACRARKIIKSTPP